MHIDYKVLYVSSSDTKKGHGHFIFIFIYNVLRGKSIKWSLPFFKMVYSSVAKQHICCIKFPFYSQTVDGVCYEVWIMKSGMHGEIAMLI